MRLLDLALQIDRVGQPIVEDGGHIAAAFLGKINFRLVHSLLLGIGGSARRLFCTARRRIPSAPTLQCAASAFEWRRISALPPPARRPRSLDWTGIRLD